MIVDLATVARVTPRQCDVLILGAGPAGITLALELNRAAPELRIVLAEAGGLEPPAPEGRDLYKGQSLGSSKYSLTASRLRYFGGTSGHWGGWSRPLDAVDFKPRPQAGNSGWPLARDDLQRHYEAAHQWLEIPSHDYRAGHLSSKLQTQLLDLDESPWFRNRVFRFSPPTRFGSRYREDVEQAENLECLINAAAVAYEFDGQRVSGVVLSGLHGRNMTVSAKQVVVAMGGIESARHLLLMREHGASATGITSPVLGCGFADHFGLRPGIVQLSADRFYQRTVDDSGSVMPIICPTPEALDRTDWNNSCMMLDVMPGAAGLPDGYTDHAALGFKGGDTWRYRITMILEPRMNPQSRVELGTERDALGLPRVNLFWEIDPRDYESGHNTFVRFAQEMGRLGLGRAQIRPLNTDANRSRANGTNHHLGTARMAENAQQGVVDRDLKVFGSDNLSVLSSAVFPTYGFSNPTMTIVALAHRLAGHLIKAGV